MIVKRLPTFRHVLKNCTALQNQNTCKRFSTAALPELTKDRYKNVQRGNFSKVDKNHINYFVELLGKNQVITDPEDCLSYNVDWINTARGYSSCVLKPKTTSDVSNILKFCNDHNLAVCPQGGNTGLVAGSVPVFDEIVLSTALMNNVINLDKTAGILTCQAGCILENLENYLSEYDLMMPLDLGAKGSCHIGGNVSTNAGGIRLLRYGNLQGTILGIEAVLANGEVLDCLSALKKDNTGYHLKHLFIGSEGSLGIVTKVAIHCPPKPRAVNIAFLGLDSFEKVLEVYARAKRDLGEILSSCELIDDPSLDVCTTNLKMKSPLPQFPFYMLIETHGSENAHDEEKMTTFLEKVLGDNIVLDGLTTNEPSKMKVIWDLRERLADGLLCDGYFFSYDISVPIDNFYKLVLLMKERLGSEVVRVSGFGHLGDSNLHLNVTVREFSTDILNKIEPYVYECTAEMKGSVSAEHGLGFRKSKYIHYSKSKTAVSLMKDLKHMMDPKGILNPYKVLPLSPM